MPKFNADTGQWEQDAVAQAQVPIVTPESLPQVTPGVSDVAPVKVEYPITGPPASIQRPAPPPSAMQQAASMSPEQLALLASRNPVTPGISQDQIDRMANTGTYIASAESRAVSGGNPEAYADIPQIDQARREAAQAQVKAETLQAQANLDNAQARAVAARQQAEVAAAQQSEADAQWQKKWDAFQAENDPRNPDNQADPGRLFRGPGILGGILAAIGDAYSAKGAVLAHQSPPQSRVMQMIDNDLRAQQLNIMQRGQAANNKLAQLSREWGSLEAGKQALKVQQMQAVDAQLQATAAKTSDPAVKAQIAAHEQAMAADIDAETAKLKAIYGGQEARQQQGSIMRPRAASGGGINYGKLLSLKQKLSEDAREERKLDFEEKKATSDGGTLSPSQAQALAEIDTGRNAILKLAKDQGLQYDPGTGKIIRPKGWKNPVGTILTGDSRFASEQARKVNADQNSAIMLFGKPIFGNMSKDERSQAEALIKGENPEQAPEALQNALDALESRRKVWLGTVTEKQRTSSAANTRAAKLQEIRRSLEDKPVE